MVLSWNEIKDRALHFSREWEGESKERAEKDTFWNEFLNIFGITRRRVATFEEYVKMFDDSKGFIDLFWPGMLLAEHKSLGKSLDAAFKQALDYFSGIAEKDLPKYVIVSDFARFRVYDLDEKKDIEFNLSELHDNIQVFSEIAGYKKKEYKEEDPVNIKAAEMMGKLHDLLKDSGYEGHELEVFLVRLLFCLFADDTGIFEKDTFRELIETKTAEDGSNLGSFLETFFEILNTPENRRNKLLDEQVAAFPYINGKLFEERLHTAYFNSKMRTMLLEVSDLNWGLISPAIFGSMFQSIMNPEERRNLGAHYTSEKNILKVIKPLFLDRLWDEFNKIKNNKSKLLSFHTKISNLSFMDPACGSGNFLIITYRELRLLELEILKILYKGELHLDIAHLILCDVDQFYGIEYEEFPSRIAEVALWLMDHQMNLKVSETFGVYFARLPLRKSATIIHGNALRIDWEDVIPNSKLDFILGNPPFYGPKYMSPDQKDDAKMVMGNIKNYGLLDYVSNWYVKAANITEKNHEIQVAFVSTNSITMGEQVSILWDYLISNKVCINFAHRTFSWTSEAKGKAAVHVVIIGFGHIPFKKKSLFVYDDIKGEPHLIYAKNINPYLIDGKNTTIKRRKKPLCDVPSIGIGNKPIDGGYYLFTPEKKSEFILNEPKSERWFKKWVGSKEFIRKEERWCLWLGECPPDELRRMPSVMKRIESVKDFRNKSKSPGTRKLSSTPTRFHVENMPDKDYMIIPEVSSERRQFIPMGFEAPSTLASNLVKVLPNANLYLFGVLMSTMHNSWMRGIGGKLKSDYRYSVDIVYNNFPWPMNPLERNTKKVESKAQKVLEVRDEFKSSSLADLYDPLTMPPKLVKAHQELDRAVDLCYRPQAFSNETGRIEFLFDLYDAYLSKLN